MNALLVWYVATTLALTGVFWAVVLVQAGLRALRPLARRGRVSPGQSLPSGSAAVASHAAA